jgi:class 3 adenylate cyclase/pimeloyl-ACP methyl ester carboxylesterase
MVSGALIPMEVFGDAPGMVRLLDGLGTLGRVVVFDRRGVGLSDPIVSWDRPVLDQWVDDLAAVVDASGAENAVVFAWDSFGIATRFAVRGADRVQSLVLHQPLALNDDDWDKWATTRLGFVRGNLAGTRQDFLALIAPTRATDLSFREWYARAGRIGASPSTAARIWESVFGSRPTEQRLRDIRVPTLVLYRRDNLYAPDGAAELAASQIADATVVALDGTDHWPFVGDVDAVVAEIAQFVVGERRVPTPERVLSVLLFTDLVDSTAHAAAVGDARWKALLDRHDRTVRTIIGRSGGTIVKHTGDGIFALVPSAIVAIRAAAAIHKQLAADDLHARIGLHIGDIDRRGDEVSGLAVHIATRVMPLADADQTFVTAPVVATVVGQNVEFAPAGTHDLKGVPGTWPLFSASTPT